MTHWQKHSHLYIDTKFVIYTINHAMAQVRIQIREKIVREFGRLGI